MLRSTPRNTQQMYVHMPQVLSRNPFFWFEEQLERCYKWRDLSDASPSLPDLVLWGFLYFGEFFFKWKSQILPCSCFGRDSALFSRTKVSRYNAHVLSSIVTIKGFVKVLRSLQYMVCRITQTSLFSC
jgi:hypothetical protein